MATIEPLNEEQKEELIRELSKIIRDEEVWSLRIDYGWKGISTEGAIPSRRIITFEVGE